MRHSFIRYNFILVSAILLSSLACSSLTPTPEPALTYRYDNLPNAGEEDETAARFRAISQWGKTNLTYYFANGTSKINGNIERDLIRAAFQLWADETPLTFNEVSDSAQADIIIGWAEGEHGDGDPFDGPGDVLAHASYPSPYQERQVFLHFDDAERWVDSNTQNVDLLTVAAHEIGHN
ncbi:MAG TPA: matrixin family metalloprotease, partial [Anaerolineales bacterium]|nr:matrixin family metalloprotease [Anaerolineales bacterium]